MDFKTIVAEQRGSALVVRLNRPERRNALSIEMVSEVGSVMQGADSDPNVRAVILTGGPGYFSAGADLNEALAVQGHDECVAYFRRFHRLTQIVEGLAKPVIAAIEGFCLTGGLELALACDLRVGAAGSTYGITSARIGTVSGAGATQRLPRLVGPAKALEMLLSAERIGVEEAQQIGLINRLVGKGEAMAEAERITRIYEKRGPVSLAFLKRAVHRGLQMDLASGLELEVQLAAEAYGTQDRKEGIAAFLEKREPKFIGR
jgi:enoyl-CoA hydratase/carnithine racemase